MSKFTLTLCLLLIPFITYSNNTTASSDINLFRIGTGGNSGTYYPIGSIIAEAITDASNDLHSQVSGDIKLLALAQRSTGSVTNVREVSGGLLEAGFAQADVAHWAYQGSGPYQGSAPQKNLRAIATLYLESLHLVARKGSGIVTVSNLSGHTVSLDEEGSGTLLAIGPVLDSFGISTDLLDAVYLKPIDAIDRMRQNELDAFFIVAGYPIQVVSQLIAENVAELIPIAGLPVDRLLLDYPFFTSDTIPADTYSQNTPIPTIAVAAQLVTHANIAENLIYQITEKLWSLSTQKSLTMDHPKGNDVRLDQALVGLGIPLHSGSERFYKEIGLLSRQ